MLFGGKSIPSLVKAAINALKKVLSKLGIDPATIPGMDMGSLIAFLKNQIALIPNPLLFVQLLK